MSVTATETETGWGPLFLERKTRTVWRHDQVQGERTKAATLTPRELEVLWFFTEHPRVALTRSQIYRAIWGVDLSDTSNALGIIILRLREKLGKPNLIHTVRQVGYKLDVRR